MTDETPSTAITTAQATTAVGMPIEHRMAMLREALTNPDVDPAKAVAMCDLLFKLEDRDREAEFNRSLIAAKSEIGPIFKDGNNPHLKTKFATFERIQQKTDPILEKHGLSLDYRIGSEGQNITVTPVMRHQNGWIEIGDAIKGPPDEGPGRSKIMAIGSSASYLQRYAVKAVLNLRFHGDDDDGRGGAATSYEGLPDNLKALIDDAREKAKDGTALYATYFKTLTAEDRGFLAFNRAETGETWHEQNKRAALAFEPQD